MRPVWFEFPEAEALYGVQDQFMLGPALLAAPVLQEGATSRAVLLPQQATWFDASTGAWVMFFESSGSAGGWVGVHICWL
jgi:alpha-glucosidase (family GH31 glycosyl hydrolase)